jgi:hypothetical protein
LPANGFCGHGFWQFSPELFFSLYSEANGYQDTEVFLADLADEQSWYRVKKPRGGKRADVVTTQAVYVLVRTRLVKPFSHDHVQQSDYEFAWEKTKGRERAPEAGLATSVPGSTARPGAKKPRSRKMPILSWIALLAFRKISAFFRPTSLTPVNPYLTAIDITDPKFG